MQIVDTQVHVRTSGNPLIHQQKLSEAQRPIARVDRHVVPLVARMGKRHSGLRPIIEHLEHPPACKHEGVFRRNVKLQWQRKVV